MSAKGRPERELRPLGGQRRGEAASVGAHTSGRGRGRASAGVTPPRWRARIALAIAAAAILAGCAPHIAEVPAIEGRQPAGFPEAEYRSAAAQGEAVFRIDPKASLAVIEVRRAGSLARLGHDHVVASHDVQGYVRPAAGRADLYVAFDRLVVDEPDLRREAGFDTHPSPEAIEGTRRNMLGPVLDAERYPFAVIAVKEAGLSPGTADGGGTRNARVSITLHGVARDKPVALRIDTRGDELDASGTFALDQSEFGITPLSVLGGAIQVQDHIDLRFRIHARRLRPEASAGAGDQAPRVRRAG